MEDSERFRLLGMYQTPRFRYGRKVLCQVRGEVRICGITDARIPWPLARRGRGSPSLVVYKDLARAVRRESNQAICRWWGVTAQTVSKWRKALGVGIATEGTSLLHSENAFEPVIVEALRRGQAKNRDPQRCRKIAEAKRVKRRPAHVVEAVRQAHLGTRHSEESRRKMSETRRRGVLLPGTDVWTPEEDELLRTLPAAAARRTSHSLGAVYTRRGRLGLPDGRRKSWSPRRQGG